MQHYLDARDVPKTNEVVLGSRARFDYSPQRRSLTALAWDGPLGWFERAHVDLSYTLLDEGERIVDCVTPQPKPCAPADSESVERTRVATPGSASHFTRRLFEAHRLTVGHEYYRDRYDVSKEVIDRDSGAVTPASPGRPDGTIYESLGLFAQDEWQLAPRWELIGGVRYSRFVAEGDGVVNGTRQTLSFESDALTASLYGLYAIAPTLRLVGGIAQGFRAPNIEDAFPQVDFTQFEPNTALEPEHSLTYEVGLKWGLPAYQGELFVYQSDYEDLIARTNIEDGRRQNQNINEATIRGVEFAGRGTLAPGWTTRLTMTYTRGDIRPLNAAECGGTDECPARRIPPFNGAWSLRYMPGLRWFAEADMFFADGQHRLNPGDVSDARIGPRGTPGYVTFGLRGGWNPLPATQLVLVVENLGGRLYKTHGSGIYAPGLSARVAIRQAF
jgi:hemoglobin/transferrin/lactoferrin receptor protein